MTNNHLINYTFASRSETFIFFFLFSYQIPPELDTSYSYFHGNIFICVSSIKICSPFNRAQWEHWLYYHSFDWNVVFQGKHRIRYNQSALKNFAHGCLLCGSVVLMCIPDS